MPPFIPATFAAIAPEQPPEIPMRWSDIEAQCGVQLEATTAESALRNIEDRARLRASPAWEAGVISTVEELDMLEAAVRSYRGKATMYDVIRALRKGQRDTELAAFSAYANRVQDNPQRAVLANVPSETIPRPVETWLSGRGS